MSDRLRIAVFIDFDNIEIGVKNTLGASFDAGLVLEALKERGEVVSKMAYSDWQRAGGYSRALTQHAIRMVQRNLTPGGDKNGADINLALDALEMAFTHPHINAFVIVGGDSDFISLVEKLKQYDKKVFVVGGRQFTSAIMQRNCHEFIAYENLIGSSRRSAGGPRESRAERADVSQAVPLVTRALKVLLERDVDPQLGLLKSTLLQLDSTFSERTYGAGTFRDFAQKLQQAGALRLYQGKGGWLVGPADGELPVAEAAAPVDVAPKGEPRAAEAVEALYRIISAAEIKKWPLYLRHVKQIVRAQTPPFDERDYGFASLADLLRAAHKQGAFRVERDRQGVIRVFQGGSVAPERDTTAGPAAGADETAPAEVVDLPVETATPEPAAAEADAEVEATEPPATKRRRTRAPRRTPKAVASPRKPRKKA